MEEVLIALRDMDLELAERIIFNENDFQLFLDYNKLYDFINESNKNYLFENLK